MPCAAVLIGLDYLKSAWAAMLLFHAVIVICLLFKRRSRPCSGLFKGWNTSFGAVSILISAVCGPLLILLWPVIAETPDGMASTLEEFGLHGIRLWVFSAYFVSLHPVLEEMFWRGVMAPESSKTEFVDIAFGAYHVLVLIHFLKLPWVMIAYLILVLVSWMWRYIADRFGGLAVPVVSHIIAGAGIMAATYFLLGR